MEERTRGKVRFIKPMNYLMLFHLIISLFASVFIYLSIYLSINLSICRNISYFKTVLLSGLRDADNNTRKLARLLYRYCRESDLLARCLSTVLDEQDAQVQRLLQSENLSSELTALKQLAANSSNSMVDDELFPNPPQACVASTTSRPTMGAAERLTATMPLCFDEFKTVTETAIRPLSDSIKPSERRLSVMGPKRIVAGANNEAKPAQAARL
jgi:hypothetical protein